MKRFILNTLLYLVLLALSLFVVLTVLSKIVDRREFKSYNTESNLLLMEENQHYDLLFMGISHARNFSRHKNHLRVEKLLDASMYNIAQGLGRCGANEQHFYLDYFYYKGNTASKLVYIISPPLFFSENLTVTSSTFNNETFRFDFFFRYLFFSTENKSQRVTSYVQSKFRKSWFDFNPASKESEERQLENVDMEAVKEGQKMVYTDSLTLDRCNKNLKAAERSIKLALENNSEVVLIITPAVFGQWRGHQFIDDFATEMSKIKGVSYYDFSDSCYTINYYYDHHHFNSKGIEYFTEKFLKPILSDTVLYNTN